MVVGGSFAGMSAAMHLARARRRVLVVDAGRPRNRFARASHGFPGQDGRAPGAIMATLRAELLAYPTAAFAADEATHARAIDGTTVPGVFAAGDTTRVPPNATLAAAEGMMAGVGAHQSLVFAAA